MRMSGKARILGAVVVLALSGAAQGGVVLGWDDLADGALVPLNYLGFTWSGDQAPGGSGDWFAPSVATINANYGSSLPEISAPNVASNSWGDDDTWVLLGGDYFLESAFYTRWPNVAEFGAPAIRVTGYDDGALVYDETFATTEGVWSFADFGGVVIDELHISRTTPIPVWWLMDDLTLQPVGVCPWDCGGDNDGNVGIVDFLALLAQWDQVGTSCDFDGSGVGIVDFLKLLANWGVCP